MRHIRNMELLVNRMLNDGRIHLDKFHWKPFRSSVGHRFEKTEIILNNLPQGIW